MEYVIPKKSAKEAVNDKYFDKYGYAKEEVEECYKYLQAYNELKTNKKKLAAVEEYAKDKEGEPKQIINTIEDLEKAYNKKMGKSGEDYYHNDDNDFDENREDFKPKDKDKEE